MNFTNVLVAIFLTVIFVANVEAIGTEVHKSCEQRCKDLCVTDYCTEKCMEHCHHPPISPKVMNCHLTCSTNRCSKFRESMLSIFCKSFYSTISLSLQETGEFPTHSSSIEKTDRF